MHKLGIQNFTDIVCRLFPIVRVRANTRVTAILISMSFLVFSAGCISDESSILGRWHMVSIDYGDGSEKILGGENSVVFEEKHIVEQIEGFGNRRYTYVKKNSQLILKSGGEDVIWTLVGQSQDSLKIDTPIGIYNLSR